MKSYVFTLGFHEDYVERRLYQTHASHGDPILLFTAKPSVGGVLRAYESLRFRASSIGISTPKLVELPIEEPSEALYIACDEIFRLYEPIIADLSGGMRAVVLMVYTALLLSGKDFSLYVQPEGSGLLDLKIPRGIIRSVRYPLSEEKLGIMRVVLENPGVSVDEIALILKKKSKTIMNHLSELKKLGLVVQKGRKSGVYPTEWAKVLVVTA